jgi:hypothetical protein
MKEKQTTENLHKESSTFDGGFLNSTAGTYATNFVLGNLNPDVSEQFKIVYELIKKGAITCEEAWTLMLNIVPRKTEYVPYTPYQPPYYTTPGTPITEPFKIYCSHSVAKTGDSPLK